MSFKLRAAREPDEILPESAVVMSGYYELKCVWLDFGMEEEKVKSAIELTRMGDFEVKHAMTLSYNRLSCQLTTAHPT